MPGPTTSDEALYKLAGPTPGAAANNGAVRPTRDAGPSNSADPRLGADPNNDTEAPNSDIADPTTRGVGPNSDDANNVVRKCQCVPPRS